MRPLLSLIRPLMLLGTLSLSLTACQAPGGEGDSRDAPAKPIASPDTSGAYWTHHVDGRLLFFTPGQPPMLALYCLRGEEAENAPPQLIITRDAAADSGASAMMAILGNGKKSRLPVNVAEVKSGPVWLGAFAADDPQLNALIGGDEIELTIPGAGSLIMQPSPLPQIYISLCRSSEAQQPNMWSIPRSQPPRADGPNAASDPAIDAATDPATDAAMDPATDAAMDPATDAATDPSANRATDPADETTRGTATAPAPRPNQ